MGEEIPEDDRTMVTARAAEVSRGVVVVEDDADQRWLLEEAVRAVPGLQVARSTGRGVEALALVHEPGLKPSLVLLDLRLPDADGLDVLRTYRTAWPEASVLVVSALSDEKTVVQAIRRGARGYVLKDGTKDEIVTSLQQVLGGHYAISPAVARHLVAQLQVEPPAAAQDEDALTARELEVLERIARGASYKEVAAQMGVQQSTVEAHIKNLYRKLEVHSKVQAILEAKARGYLA